MPKYKYRRGLHIPDSHIPYHDKNAYKLLRMVAEGEGFNYCVIGGDWLDMRSMSSHPKRRPGYIPTFREEIEVGNYEMDLLEAALGSSCTKKYYIEGNHEERFQRFVAENSNLDGFTSIPQALNLHKRGWKWIPYRQELKLGNFIITHDYENAGENAHRQAGTKVGGNVLIHHTHRMGYDVKGSARGLRVSCMLGWLGDDEAGLEYKSKGSMRHEWVKGFGESIMTPNGDVHLTPCPIIKGKVSVFGSIYSLR